MKPTQDNVLLTIEEEKSLIIVENKELTKKILRVKDFGKDVTELKKGQRVWLSAYCNPAEIKIKDEMFVVCKEDDIIVVE